METTDKRREIAEAARHQLEGTFASVKTRLHPKALSREMVARAKAKARDTAEDAANAVKALKISGKTPVEGEKWWLKN
jgi:hypothetical protein